MEIYFLKEHKYEMPPILILSLMSSQFRRCNQEEGTDI